MHDDPRTNMREKFAQLQRREQVRATLAQARRRRERRGLLLWLVTITVMMALTVALGVYLHAFELLATSIATVTSV